MFYPLSHILPGTKGEAGVRWGCQGQHEKGETGGLRLSGVTGDRREGVDYECQGQQEGGKRGRLGLSGATGSR